MKKTLALVLVTALLVGSIGMALAGEKTRITVWTTGSQNVQDLFTVLRCGLK